MRRTRIGQCGTGSRRNYGKRAAHVWDVDEVILPSFKDAANEGISP